MKVKYLPILLICHVPEILALKRTQVSSYERKLTEVSVTPNGEMDWVSPDELVDHLHTLSKITGAMSPYKVPGYSGGVARMLHRHFSKNAPKLVDHIVNLGHHYAGSDRSRVLSGKEKIPDVAKRLKKAHYKTKKNRFLQASAINTCAADPGCEHDPCTKTFLDTPYTPFDPAYGGGGGYNAAVASIRNTVYWDGDETARTDTDGYSANLIALQAATIAKEVSDALCDGIDDSIKVCILCAIFELPNPPKIICQVADALLDVGRLILDSFKNQMDYHESIVQGAEIEASYEHTRNLLHKQCATYDEALCRCSQSLENDGYGLGCDGLDSNCNDEVDECDEDKIAPTIDISATLERCGGYFATIFEAETCVLESAVATDDCQAVDLVVTDSSSACDQSFVTITATERVCGKSSEATITVFVDGGAPTVGCTFSGQALHDITVTGARLPEDVGFVYTASDNCGKPMNVTVDVYSSQIEDFNAQEMVLFFRNNNPNDAAELYLASHICSTSSNGQCIEDPNAADARLYTAIVSATDVAGNSAESECQVRVVPQNTNNKDISTEDSTQRFPIASYTSLWSVFP